MSSQTTYPRREPCKYSKGTIIMCGVNLTAVGEMRRRRESMKGSTTEPQARLLSGIVYNDDKHTSEFMALPKWVSSQIIESVTTGYFTMNVTKAMAGPYGIYNAKL